MGQKNYQKDTRREKNRRYIRKKNKQIYLSYKKPTIDAAIKAKRLEWFDHFERMPEERLVKKIAWKKPDYKKKKGRPKIQQKQALMTDLKEKIVDNQKSKVKDREAWETITKLYTFFNVS